MAPVNEGITHVHNQPASKITNLRETKIHSSKRPYDAVCVLVRKSNSTPVSGNYATDSNPPPPPPPPQATEDNGASEIDRTSPGPYGTDGDGMSTLEKMLGPPEFDAKSPPKHQDVKVFQDRSCHPNSRPARLEAPEELAHQLTTPAHAEPSSVHVPSRRSSSQSSITSSSIRSVQAAWSVRLWRPSLGLRSGGRRRCTMNFGMATRSLSKAR
jgi:hypothetical protein